MINRGIITNATIHIINGKSVVRITTDVEILYSKDGKILNNKQNLTVRVLKVEKPAILRDTSTKASKQLNAGEFIVLDINGSLRILSGEQIKQEFNNSNISIANSDLSKNKVKGYGLLDTNMNGISATFQEFIIARQTETQKILKDYPILNCAFSKIFEKYKDLLVGDNSLVPIDTNAKNIMLTQKGDVKFIDPGELVSAPKLMGYGDFVAHVYKTELYDCLIQKLKLDKDDEKRLRIYAIFSSLNILAFLKNLGIDDLERVIPYGNKYTFYELIKEHLENIEIDCEKE